MMFYIHHTHRLHTPHAQAKNLRPYNRILHTLFLTFTSISYLLLPIRKRLESR